MWRKSRDSGKWTQGGAADWPDSLTKGPVNHLRHDNCAWCGKPKPFLMTAPTTDRFGRPSGERICVVCMGGRRHRQPEPPAQNGGEEKPIPVDPLPQKEYIIKELCAIFNRSQAQLQLEVGRRNMGRMCVSGKRPFRVLSWEESEGLRVEFLRRQQQRLTRRGKRGEGTTEPNFGTLPKSRPRPKMRRHSNPEEEEVVYGK